MKKGILILTLLILAMFSVSCVCAGDVDDALAASEDAAAIEEAQSYDDETVNAETDLEILSAGECNYSDLRSDITHDGSLTKSYSDDDGKAVEISSLSNDIDDESAEIAMVESNIKSSRVFDGSAYYVDGSVSVSGDGNQSTPFKTLIEALNVANNGDVIYMASGIYTGQQSNVGIGINKEIKLTAYGDGPVILDGQSSIGIFYVITDNVEIRGITFVNGLSDGGGAIYWDADYGVLANCSFINSSAEHSIGHSGGAIYMKGNYSTVANCTFVNNSASYGGAIDWHGDYGVVANCTFINNLAFECDYLSGHGGAIFWQGDEGNITSSIFIDNKAAGEDGIAGAILAGNHALFVKDSIFFNNTDEFNRGIFGDFVVSDCNWFGNTYYNPWEAPGVVAECNNWLYLKVDADLQNLSQGDSLTVNYDLYKYDKDTGESSLYNNSNVPIMTFDVSSKRGLTNVTSLNLVNGHASILYTSLGPLNDLSIRNSTFYLEVHANSDGAYYVDGSVSVSGDGNQSSPFKTLIEALNVANNGDVIYMASGIYTGQQSNVGLAIYKEIILTTYGDGPVIFDGENSYQIFQIYSDNVVLNQITFINAKSTRDLGGAIASSGANVTLLNCSFINCTSNMGGAVFFDAEGIVENCSFINCSSNYGGAIYFYRDGNVTNCNFVDNTALMGGAIYFNTQALNAMVRNCNFVNNSATDYGGAIFNGDDLGVTADTCIFKTDSDTTIRTLILPPTLNVDNFTKIYNSDEKLTFDLKTNSGMPVDNGNISISVYTNNHDWVGNYSCLSGEGWTADLPVGSYYAIFNTEYAGFTQVNRTVTIITSNTFKALNHMINANNKSEINLGHDFYFDPEYDADFAEGIVISRPVTINGNGYTINAKGKARVFNVQASDATIKNITFINANATGDGGAVLWNGGNGHLSDCSFANNSAQNHGGAIYWDGAYGVISGCSFEDNFAQYGGAVVLSGSHGNVSGCSFEDNSAVYGGGLLWSASYGDVYGCSFANNFADYGGAIRCSVYNGAVSACSFEDNCADYGSAIYWGDIDLGTISGCIFMNNSANNGVVYRLNDNYGNNFRVNNNVFLANNCSAIALSKNDSAINADFNWFGHNASDYMDNLNLAGCNVWLFLNATADSSTLDLFGATDIAFRLYMYNSTSQNTSEYENTLLKQVTLTITPTNGNVNASVAGLGETVAYTATATGKGSVAAAVGNALYAVEFDILKGSSQLTSKNLVTVYNANGYLVVTLKDARGKAISGASITVSLNGVKTYTTDKNGQVKVATKALVPKTHYAKITFAGNSDFKASSATAKVTVKKATPKLTAKAKAFKKSVKTKKYAVTLKDNTGKAMKKVKLTLKIKNKKFTAKTNAKGKATFKIKKFTKKGTFKATIAYKGNAYYNKATKKVTIKIK